MTRRAPSLVMYFGIVALVMAMSKIHATWIADPAYDFTGSSRFGWAWVYSGLIAASAYSVGLPDVPRRARQIAAAAVAAMAISFAGVSTLQLLMGSPLLPRFVVASTAFISILWLAASAVLARGGRSRARSRDRVVLIGGQEDAANLGEELGRSPERPATIVASLTIEEAMPSGDDLNPVRTAADMGSCTLVVLDRAAQSSQPIVDQVALLHEDGLRVRTLSLFYEQWLGKLPIGELERVSLMFDIGEIHRMRYSRLKRLIDVSVALFLLPLLVAVIPVILTGNIIANRGRLFYNQDRVGKGGRVFRIHKFRTMRISSQEGQWSSEGDGRITPWGRVLRSTHMDELPQLVNILRGELSLVGPRPEQPHYVAQLEAKLPYYQLRHLVQPGLTGWAQVKYGYARSEMDALEKLQFEFYYLRRQALAVDLRIMVRTLRTVLPFGGPSWL